MKILLADDELSMRTLIQQIVEDAGYDFISVSDGTELMSVLETERPDLLLLDVMMPRMDGFTACRELRGNGFTVPIIFISAKGDIVDKSVGFNAGGDDYIVKPFIPEELLLRVDALLRRQRRGPDFMPSDILHQGDLELDTKRHKAFIKGRQVELTVKEFHILLLLASQPGIVFTREQIIEAVWGKEYIEESSSISVFIRRIRTKIEEDPSNPRYIQTVWRVGYRFGD
jgi:two-component system response regulator VicR